jgi:hypothetical protein
MRIAQLASLLHAALCTSQPSDKGAKGTIWEWMLHDIPVVAQLVLKMQLRVYHTGTG